VIFYNRVKKVQRAVFVVGEVFAGCTGYIGITGTVLTGATVLYGICTAMSGYIFVGLFVNTHYSTSILLMWNIYFSLWAALLYSTWEQQ
jgi:hypothetical protein